MPSNHFNLARLRSAIKPFRLHYFPRLRSTNDHAAVLRRRGDLFAPSIVLTAHQLAGRGRGANRWFSTTGVLTVTAVMPIEEHLQPHQLPLIAGLAVRSASDELLRAAVPVYPPLPQLKWPNDVLCNDRKLAGLLCERIHKCDLIGIGLNVNLDPAAAPEAFRPGLTSLAALTGRTLDMTDVLITVVKALRETLARREQTTFADFLQEYDRHHVLVGRTVTVAAGDGQAAIVGRCEGLDQTGRLLIRDGHSLHRIIAGHVSAR